MISPETIKKLHELNCEDVARRLGLEVNMHQAHCFMHQDKRPSLAFKNNLWKCFACDKGGDAISLVEEKCNLSFVEACTWLCEQYHIYMPSTNLKNLIYNYLTICKWVVYKFCFWNKKQIRNKNGFLGKSSFFCLHYFSFLSLACNQSTNPSYYYAFSSWFNICFFIYPGIRSEKRKVLFSMIDINMCKVKNNHPSNQIFVYF